MKILLLFAITLAVVTAGIIEAPKRRETNLDLCDNYDSATDKIVFERTVDEYGIPFRIREAYVTFPDFGSNDKIITCIRVRDLLANGWGAEVLVDRGGPDFTYTTLKFKSRVSAGIKSNVKIYVKAS